MSVDSGITHPALDYEEGEVCDLSESDHETPPSEHNVQIARDSAHSHRKRRKHGRRSGHRGLCLKEPKIVPGSQKPGEPDDLDAHHRPHCSAREDRIAPLSSRLSGDEPIDLHILEPNLCNKKRSTEQKRSRKKSRRETCNKRSFRGRFSAREHVKDGVDRSRRSFPPQKKQELCKFYAVGVCSRSFSCPYLHGEFPCKFFHITKDCHHGDNCKFSHAPLTPSKRSLLEKVSSSKCSDRSSIKHGKSWTPDNLKLPYVQHTADENGDVDYRFGLRPSRTNMSYEPRPLGHHMGPQHLPAPNLFSPVFPGEPRSFNPEIDRMPIRNIHPFSGLPHDQLPHPRYPQDGRIARQFAPGLNDPFFPPNYLPMRLPNATCPNGINGFRPPPLLDNPIGYHSSNLPGPLMHVPDAGPRYKSTPLELFLTSRNHPPMQSFNPAYKDREEALVSSELDKMAALLASKKPSADEPKPSPPVVNIPSESSPTMNVGDHSRSNARTDEDVGSPSLDNRLAMEPDTNQPLVPMAPGSPVTWRLIPLDMSVKIPYPLMQLPVNELPHRFDDPRLRGQITALRPQIQHSLPLDNGFENISSSSVESESKIADESDRGANAATQRRPVKLQLNEMASTFVNTNLSVPNNIPSRQGDRSYLDDPRFRRRRILTTGAAAPNHVDPNEVINRSDELHQVELSGPKQDNADMAN